MEVATLRVTNFRCFPDSGTLSLGRINVLVGPNNAGKSSLLKALYLLQQGAAVGYDDIRKGSQGGQVTIDLTGLPVPAPHPSWGTPQGARASLLIDLPSAPGQPLGLRLLVAGGQMRQVSQIPNVSPNHFMVPFFARRRTRNYAESVGQANASTIDDSLQWLSARLSMVSNPYHPSFASYNQACEEILGFTVTGVNSTNGMLPGVFLPNRDHIFIESMGDGVPHIVGMLADLALHQEKLFLIEEIEDGLHPAALKALLRLILESSSRNQFVVATHSNIVARYLGSAPDSKLFYVEGDRAILPPSSTVQEIPPVPTRRFAILRELGYELADFGVSDAWIICEEASAERVIRDFLIPTFLPGVRTRVRTISAAGADRAGALFEDFRRLVLFAHLEPAFKQHAWVLVDGDARGREIVNRLRATYRATWPEDSFRFFPREAFEYYYPPRFQADIASALGTKAKLQKQEAKAALVQTVMEWVQREPAIAKEEFAESAREVIDMLKEVTALL